MNHRFTWRGYCAFEIESTTVGDAVQMAIADKPIHIPAGTGLFYGMAGGSNKGAVYVVPGQASTGPRPGDSVGAGLVN